MTAQLAEFELRQTEQAMAHTRQALAIARETGSRSSEGVFLGNLGSSYLALGQTERAVQHFQQACEIGDKIKDAEVQAEARLGLAQVHLYREEWRDARQIAEAAPSRRCQPVLTQVLVALGTGYLREGNRAKASEAFSAGLSAASTSLSSTAGNAHVLYSKGSPAQDRL